MFIQIIQGKCTRQDELRALADTWREEMAPSADGWLGGTYGFTDDDQFVGIIRFESREAATRNSERPEQGEWAKRMTALLDGPVEYHDCDDVTLMLDGGSDDAGFVQVIRGKVDDPQAQVPDGRHRHAPRAPARDPRCDPRHRGGRHVHRDRCLHRRGERAEGESKEMPEMPAEVRETLEAAMQGATYYDLHHPWFASGK